MRIDGIGSNSVVAVKPNPPKKGVSEKPIEAAPQVVEKPESEEKTKGVIRLLQAGHFKGVADVRLRINFHDEIQALETQHLKHTAASGFEDLNQTIQDQIALLKESGQLDDDQTAALDAFLEGLRDGQAKFLNGENLALQGWSDKLRAELDSLVELLTPPALAVEEEAAPATEEIVAAIEPQAGLPETPPDAVAGEQPPVEEIIPEPAEAALVESPAEEPDPLRQLVQSFQESVRQALEQFQSNLTGSSALPPISEPSGNGKAFAKFIAIYESMKAGPDLDIPEPQLLDSEEVIVPDETEFVSQTT